MHDAVDKEVVVIVVVVSCEVIVVGFEVLVVAVVVVVGFEVVFAMEVVVVTDDLAARLRLHGSLSSAEVSAQGLGFVPIISTSNCMEALLKRCGAVAVPLAARAAR